MVGLPKVECLYMRPYFDKYSAVFQKILSLKSLPTAHVNHVQPSFFVEFYPKKHKKKSLLQYRAFQCFSCSFYTVIWMDDINSTTWDSLQFWDSLKCADSTVLYALSFPITRSTIRQCPEYSDTHLLETAPRDVPSENGNCNR